MRSVFGISFGSPETVYTIRACGFMGQTYGITTNLAEARSQARQLSRQHKGERVQVLRPDGTVIDEFWEEVPTPTALKWGC